MVEYTLSIMVGIFVFGIFATLSGLMTKSKRNFLDHYGEEVDVDTLSRIERNEKKPESLQESIMVWIRRHSDIIFKIGKLFGVNLAKIERKIIQSDMPWNAEDIGLLQTLALVVGGSLALVVFASQISWILSLMVLFFTFIAWYYPMNKMDSTIKKRLFAFEKDFPDFLDGLEIPLSNGLPILRVMEKVASGFPGIVGEEFRRVVKESKLQGERMQKPLEDITERFPMPMLTDFISAFFNAQKTGTDLGGIIGRMSKEIRIKATQLAQKKNNEATTKLVMVTGLFFVIPYLIMVLAPVLYTMFSSLGSGL